MQKSIFGVSVGVVGAAMYLLSLFSGYMAALLLIGYVLLFESNTWLKRTAVKVAVVTFIFSVASALLGLLPSCISTIHSFLYLFDSEFYISFVSNLVSFLRNVLNLAQTVLMLGLAWKALSQSTIVIKPIDAFVSKCME